MACVPAWYVCLSVSESSAGVGDGDDGGAQSEQGGQEMGNQGGQGTQEYHSLQESKTVSHTHSCLSHILTSEYSKQIQTLFLIKLCVSVVLSLWRSARATACPPLSKAD